MIRLYGKVKPGSKAFSVPYSMRKAVKGEYSVLYLIPTYATTALYRLTTYQVTTILPCRMYASYIHRLRVYLAPCGRLCCRLQSSATTTSSSSRAVASPRRGAAARATLVRVTVELGLHGVSKRSGQEQGAGCCVGCACGCACACACGSGCG